MSITNGHFIHAGPLEGTRVSTTSPCHVVKTRGSVFVTYSMSKPPSHSSQRLVIKFIQVVMSVLGDGKQEHRRARQMMGK